MQDTSVGFVVVSYNAADLLERCLESLYRQSAGPSCIVVVDNGSVDATAERLRRDHPTVRLIELGRNEGFAAACNVGIRALFADPACRYVGLVNQDAWLADDWVERLLRFAEGHPRGAGFQGLTVDGRDHDVVDSFGLYVGRAGRAIQLGYRSRNPPSEAGEVFGVNAAAALYRRAFLCAQPFGGEYLDADLFMYLEDVDLAARAVVMGWHNYFVKGAVAYHLGSGEDRENRPLSLRMTSRNDVLVLVKNLPWPVVLRSLPGMARSELARLRLLVNAGEFAKFAAVLRGRLESLLLLPRFVGKRRLLRAHRSVARAHLQQLMQGGVLRLEEPRAPQVGVSSRHRPGGGSSGRPGGVGGPGRAAGRSQTVPPRSPCAAASPARSWPG
jgi:GT2 family glycosyltransferase